MKVNINKKDKLDLVKKWIEMQDKPSLPDKKTKELIKRVKEGDGDALVELLTLEYHRGVEAGRYKLAEEIKNILG